MLDSDNFNATAKAHFAAIQQGHEPDTKDYFNAMKQSFSDMASPAVTPSPVFEPPPLRSPNRSSIVSAPVSRDIPTSTPGERPGRVTLSVAEKEMADRLGMSHAEYAAGRLEMDQRKRDGYYDR